MTENTIIEFPTPEGGVDYLTQVLRDGARRLLAQAVEAEAANLSPGAVRRLVGEWQGECEAWNKRDLTGKSYIYVWADGVYLRARRCTGPSRTTSNASSSSSG